MDTYPKPLNAAPHQVEHLERILNILESSLFYFDTSPTGEGKTEISLLVAKALNLQLFVVCPASVLSVWHERSWRYGIKISFIQSYETLRLRTADSLQGYKYTGKDPILQEKARIAKLLRSTPGYYVNDYHNPSNPFLLRVDQIHPLTSREDGDRCAEPAPIYIPYFDPATEKLALEPYIQRGTLFIFDEVQKCKNDRSTSRMVGMLSALIQRYPNNLSRIAYLSASPFDKEEHSISFFQMIGILTYPVLIAEGSNHGGLDEVQHFCASIDPTKTNTIMPSGFRSNSVLSISHIFYQLWSDIVVGYLTSRMRPRRRSGEINNLIVNYPVFLKNNIAQNISDINTLMMNEDKTGNNRNLIARRKFNGELTIYMLQREMLRVPTILTLAKHILDSTSDYKVVIIVKYIDYVSNSTSTKSLSREKRETKLSERIKTPGPLQLLAYYLQDYNPLILSGVTASARSQDRIEILRSFNESRNHRLLIGQIDAMSVGISLHDQILNMPRYIISLAEFNVITMHQVEGRFDRYGSISKPIFNWLYYKEISEDNVNLTTGRVINPVNEYRIFDTITRKSTVLHVTVGDRRLYSERGSLTHGSLPEMTELSNCKLENGTLERNLDEIDDSTDPTNLTSEEIAFQEIKFPGDHAVKEENIIYPYQTLEEMGHWMKIFIEAHPMTPMNGGKIDQNVGTSRYYLSNLNIFKPNEEFQPNPNNPRKMRQTKADLMKSQLKLAQKHLGGIQSVTLPKQSSLQPTGFVIPSTSLAPPGRFAPPSGFAAPSVSLAPSSGLALLSGSVQPSGFATLSTNSAPSNSFTPSGGDNEWTSSF